MIERREPWETPRDHALIAAMAAGVQTVVDEGSERLWAACPGSTDASYLVPAGIPCLICGPGDVRRCHCEAERITIAELGDAARAYFHAAPHHFQDGQR